MSVQELRAQLADAGVQVRRDGDRLVLSGHTEHLDAALLTELRAHKDALMEVVETISGDARSSAFRIGPEMLTLVDLTQEEIDRVVSGVEGGAPNVQDIYPLAPLQDGILFHHLMAKEGDPYLAGTVIGFDRREGLDRFVAALQAVIDRHDILRTAVMWEGLREPVQVVWRKAPLAIEEVDLRERQFDPAAGDVAAQLQARFDPRHHRIDLRQAPMIRLYIARDPAADRWLLFYLRHHIVMDHTTTEVLWSEIEAHLADRAHLLPAPLPFRNYVAQTRLGMTRDEHRAFFTELLGDVSEPTTPFGLQDVRGDGSSMREARLSVDQALGASLRERARTLGVGAASVCHVAWAQVLARTSGRDDVVFGTLLLGRMHGGKGSERVMGPFINTLPIRLGVADAEAEASVRHAHALLARLLRHEHASLALAQRCSGVDALAPLFTSLLNYRHSVRKQRPADAIAARTAVGGMKRFYGEERTNYPLTMSVDDLGDRFRLKAQVLSASLDPARVCAFMHRALEGLVDALETEPTRSLDRIDVLPERERVQVVEAWNQTQADYPAASFVHTLFEAWAQRAPDAPAVIHARGEISYAELNARANRLAHHLRALGVGPDVRVALVMTRSPELIEAELAVLKCGGAYVPLGSDESLRERLIDCAPAVVLTTNAWVDRVQHLSVPVVAVDAASRAWASNPSTNLEVEGLTPDHLAYVTYEGVMMPHRAIVRLVVNNGQVDPGQVNTVPDDRVAFIANPALDAATFDVWTPLVNGGATVIVAQDVLHEPRRFAAALRTQKVSVLRLPVGLFNQYREALQDDWRRLRVLMVGGDALNPRVIDRVLRHGPPTHLLGGYGQTETATLAITHAIRHVDLGARSIPLGRPIANTRAYVLDARGEPTPVGVAGEIHIGAASMARGYLGRPALTAECFVPDPFGGDPGARLYRTGDLGRWRPDGTIDFLGRAGHQVKVRGFRIEPSEIEARLLDHPGVRDAVVLLREETPGDKRLVAYVVRDETAANDALRAHLTERLPGYMVPAVYVRLKALPLTPNGIVDRNALPAPEGDAYAASTYEPPVGQTEQALAEIWSEVLGVDPVGRSDDFFDLGGHSLLAMQVISRVQQVLATDLELADLFTWPVIKDLARALEQAARAKLPPIEPGIRAGHVPLSFAQQRLWFLEQLGSLGSAYYIRRRLQMRGKLDRAALARALDGIVARHESLRTTFVQVDDVPVQRIAPVEAVGFALRDHDLSGRDDAAAELDRLIVEEANAPFDIEQGPLIRGRLVRLAPDDHLLLVTMHHIVSDGWSAGVFFSELSALYAAHREGRDADLPALPVQYADYAIWQRRWVEGEVLREQAHYWTKRLAGAPERLELPTDHPRPSMMNHAGLRFTVVLDEELTTGLKALSRRHGTTLFMTLLAGWAVVLSRLSGQDDVVIGTPAAGRGRQEIEGLIGFFVNTLALRIDLSGTPTVADLLARVSERVLEAQTHQDIPFEQVVERVEPTRSVAHHPLFQVMLTWQNTPRGDGLNLPGLVVREIAAPARTMAKFDVTLALSERNGRLRGTLTYATALFERATVERYVDYLRRVLQQMVESESQRVEQLALMPRSERAQVVEGWNQTDAAYPGASCLHELFEQQVARTPASTAVVFEGEHLTYAELNARANRLAHYLRSLGVGPDVRVGLCVRRSPAMVVGLLGVLKAGGVFVPLDPGYPRERLAYMLADSAPAAVLTLDAVARALADVFQGLGGSVPVIALDASAPVWANQPVTNPDPGALTPAHPAYVTYTSGSTGRPKGVPAVHRKVLNLIHWYGREFGITARDAVLLVMSFSFDGTYRNLFAPLFAGAQLHLASEPFEPSGIVAQIAAHGISTVNLTPTAFNALIEADRAGTMAGALGRMRTVILVGEAVQPRKLLELPEPRPALVNLYGPTECSGIVTYHRLSADLTNYLDRPVPAGRPIPNGRIYILDQRGEPVPVGAAGELFIGGTPVGPGYQNRPAQTAERFVADPFSEEPGARLYRTGDLARWLPDGTIELLGRMDFQVKVRGYRIELGEIEARLAEHAGVREAVVLVREDTPGEKRLVAYVVGDETMSADVLRTHVGVTLPEYMVPAAYVRLDALPQTPNGKLDRRALPGPEHEAFARRGYEAPVGEIEEALADIWAAVLRVERVGRWDHFFELGGHSLLAVQMISRVREVLEVKVGLGELFTHPVLEDFARELEQATRAALPPINPAPRDGRVPLSFAQQRLWFLEQLRDLGSMYHIRRPMRLRGDLDRAALLRALDALVARHETLRTTFASVDGVPEQRIASPETSRFTLVEHDIAGEADEAAALDRLMSEEARTRFDLEHGPLIRGRLVRFSPEDHVLLLTMHHIVSDDWSMGVLTRELGVLYRAFHHGEPSPLAALAVQYADYAVWQRQWVEGEVLREQADYWTRTLAGAPELLDVPTDHPRQAESIHHAGGRVQVVLDEAVTTGLKALGRRHGVTLFMTLMAGWTAVLSRLSGQDDVVVGMTTAGRGRREIEGLIGFFVNTLPLRLNLSNAPDVVDLLGRVKKRVLDAQHCQDIPFEQIVELVDPVRSLAHHPLFQVVFVWQSAPREGRLALPGVEESSVGAAGASDVHAKADLALTLREMGGRIVGSMTYASALFERATADRYVSYLRRVLEEMIADERQHVARLALMSESERSRVVEEWNRTDAAYPRAASVHELFEARVERVPDAVAVIFEGEHLTYGELNRRANRLAHHLRTIGVGPDARVAICVERSLAMVVGLLGVLKAGGAYVPLDPIYPAERLAYMLADSAPAVVLTQTHLRERVANTDVVVLELDTPTPAWTHQPTVNLAREALTSDHLAYVIYTSGSTGLPKGVAVSHRSVVNLLASSQAIWGLGAGDAWLQKMSLSFDVSVREIFWPLTAGARVVLARPGAERDLDHQVETILRERITVTLSLPSLLQMMLRHPDAVRCDALRLVFIGGEPLSPGLAREFYETLPAASLHHMYGPTETTVAATGRRCEPGEAHAGVPIGRPVDNARIYVLDETGEPVPVGVAGELCIGGAGVARGYLGRPRQTVERFVPDPFGGEPGARLYRTGDLGRWLPEGTIEFLGRTDDQVKVRGYRIELREIEVRLAGHASVREAVVVAREDIPGDTRLVAYWIGEAADADTLRAHLDERLPAYMVPAAYVRLDRFPLSPNGKLDRRALPAPQGDAFAAREYEAPETDTEQALAEIWAEVLRVQRVSRHDHFFDLGGHSLLAVQVISRVRQVLEVDVELGLMFTRPVLKDFAWTLETSVRSDLPPIEPAVREGRIPLSLAQQRLWFLEQLGDLGTTYQIRKTLRMRGDLNRAALARALDTIVARHEPLRTTFAQVDGVPEQRIAPADIGFWLREHDLREQTDVEAEAELKRVMIEEARTPLALEQGPLVRGHLIRLAEDDHVLFLTMHHIVSDRWSLGVFTRELSTLYAAFRRGEPDPLPALQVQYADYAVWRRRWVAGEVLQQQASYWTRTLAGVPERLELPIDRPRPARMSHAGACLDVELDEDLVAELKALSRRHGTTLFMTVLAGWAVVLGRLSGQADVVIGTPTAGRGRQEIEGLIGFFENTLALRLHSSGTLSVAELLRLAKKQVLDAQHHQDIPFEQVVELIDPVRSLSHSPLFQVMLGWLNTNRGGLSLPGLSLDSVGAASSRGSESSASHVQSKFDLTLSLEEQHGRIQGVATYATALFDRETVERYVGYLRQVLRAMAADDVLLVERLPIVPEAERRLVLDEWNRTETTYPGETSIAELFEAQVVRTPDAAAVIFEGEHLTYAELNRRANRLAHHLRSLGVGPDERVGVCVERSLDMIVGVLAVLKAGGAYVPLDPNYPVERVAYMLVDSAPAAVLTKTHLRDRIGNTSVPVVELDSIALEGVALDGAAPAWADRPATNPERGALSPAHLAYVIYTSGSTGRPKGVGVLQRNVVNRLAWLQRDWGLDEGDAVLQSTTLSFDVSVYEILWPISVGGRVVLARAEGQMDPAWLVDVIQRERIGTVNFVPSMLQVFLEHPDVERCTFLKRAPCGGEALSPMLARRFRERLPCVSLHNRYGPSEAATTVSMRVGRLTGGASPVPIGKPIANTKVYVLDRWGGPVPLGAAGELYIGGVGVGRGYLDRPGQTAERFVADPFGEDSGARLYRTGDLARWLPDGTIEFLGRTDFQTKVRGFRIEPAEIEARLLEHADVREAVVLVREDTPGDRRLVAYVAGEETAAADVLRAHLAERLPDYMVPAAYVRLEQFPLTSNGKLDRQALPMPEGDAYPAREYEAPVGETEQALVGIWSELLGIEQVGRHDNFFELGGHSLLATRLVVRIKHEMGADLALRTVFEKPQLSQLARQVLDAQLAGFDPIQIAQLTELVRASAAD